MTLTFRETDKDPFGDDDTLYCTLAAVGITMELLLAGNVGVDRERELGEVTGAYELITWVDLDGVPWLSGKSFATRFVILVTNLAGLGCRKGTFMHTKRA